MYRTFNCGVGMIIALPQSSVKDALTLLEKHGESAWVIGEIAARQSDNAEQVIIK